MTPHERAEKICLSDDFDCVEMHVLSSRIEAAIRAAVAERTEACILAADKSRSHYPHNCGCGECVGVAVAIDEIRKLNEGQA